MNVSLILALLPFVTVSALNFTKITYSIQGIHPGLAKECGDGPLCSEKMGAGWNITVDYPHVGKCQPNVFH